ncbi:MAG: S-methyl-5-thioribose-1-phosphate isomerase [Coriobacteriia bacterium]
MGVDQVPRTIWWEDGRVRLVDQSRLPLVGDVLESTGYEGIIWAISGMAIRGAPALGVAAAMGMALFAKNQSDHITETGDLVAALENVGEEIAATRPTAVNLAWGVQRMLKVARENAGSMDVLQLREVLVEEALRMADEDVERNRAMGAHGAGLFGDEPQIMTHCNAGSLATVHYGTALGVVYALQEQGKNPKVIANETRPVLQGARLTVWELMMAGVPVRLVTDNMAGALMRSGAVDAVVVGADRIAANGDVANKIGTYTLAVLAKEHDVPFYVVAPTSTVDLTIHSGDDIRIEQRDEREVAGVAVSGRFQSPTPEAGMALESLTREGPVDITFHVGHEMTITRRDTDYQLDGWFRFAPTDADIFNPAFDITPAELVTAIVTENGVHEPPFSDSLAAACEGSGAFHEICADDATETEDPDG